MCFIIFLLQMYKKSEDTRKFLALFIIISVFIYMATCCDSSFEVYRLMFGTWHHFPLLDSV